jgi:hypothetical protein
VRPSIAPFVYSKRAAAARSPRSRVNMWTTDFERFVAVLRANHSSTTFNFTHYHILGKFSSLLTVKTLTAEVGILGIYEAKLN